MGDTSGVDGIDLYADVEDFNEDLDASAGNADGSNPGRQFDGIKIILPILTPFDPITGPISCYDSAGKAKKCRFRQLSLYRIIFSKCISRCRSCFGPIGP